MRPNPLVVVLVSVLLVTSGIGVGAVGAELAELEMNTDTPGAGTGDGDVAAAIGSDTLGDAPTQTESTARGSPDMGAYVANPNVVPGQPNQVGVTITNDGNLRSGTPEEAEAVTIARNVRVTAEADEPLSVESGTIAIGSVSTSAPSEAPISVDVPENIDAGTYSLDLDITYTYVSSSGNNDRTVTVSRSVDIRVRNDARFAITNASTDAQIGDTGTIEADVENIGSDTARDVDVALDSASAGLVIGESPETGDSARIGELEPGEVETITYDASLSGDAPLREYSIEGDVQFRNADGIQRVDEGIRTGVTPLEKQRFSIDDVDSDLYVGEEGDVRGTVTNEGPNEAQNVVVQYADESPNVIPIESSVAVGTLGAGESTEFRLPIEIGGEAEPISRAADITVQYRNADLERRAYEDVELLFGVEPKRAQFLIDMQDREITAGNTITFDAEVTNNLDQTVDDVEARLFADDPLDSNDDEAYVESLEPGESTTMTFELEAESGATVKTYPISFDFRYDDERGSSQLSDTTRVAITIVPDDGGFPLLLVVGLLVVVVAAASGSYWYLRD